jgi:hypothetical protein
MSLHTLDDAVSSSIYMAPKAIIVGELETILK